MNILMRKIHSLHPALLALFLTLLIAGPVEAAKRPFKAPPGTQVSYSSTGRDYSVWTINAPDYSAIASVAKIKLPRQYWKGKAFQRYVQSALKRAWAGYGVNFKSDWKNGSYVISGTSGSVRVYAKGRITRGYWSYGLVVGEKGKAQTRALERMVKALK